MKKFYVSAMVLALAGCAADGHRAPVVYDGGEVVTAVPGKSASASLAAVSAGRNSDDWRPAEYVVKQGDTLYNIALNHGLAYRELAELNGLANPDRIFIGQRLRLLSDRAVENGQSPVVSAPQLTSPVDAKPMTEPLAKSEVSTAPLSAAPAVSSAPLDKTEVPPTTKVVTAATPISATVDEAGVKSQPKLVKYPYTEEAVAKAESVQTPVQAPSAVAASNTAVTVKASTVVPAAEKPVAANPAAVATVNTAAPDKVKSLDDGDGGSLQWSMPTSGKIIRQFSEADNQKGIDIAGKAGQPVLASAAGTVVYSGNGLRGYGKLVIIKHGKVYISAYAHNDKILVKEGQTVARGQKIAEMGNTDADQVKLHFEVRRFGKPVDPSKYLPLDNS